MKNYNSDLTGKIHSHTNQALTMTSKDDFFLVGRLTKCFTKRVTDDSLDGANYTNTVKENIVWIVFINLLINLYIDSVSAIYMRKVGLVFTVNDSIFILPSASNGIGRVQNAY
uniref:Uncharacterized protein n=1 Tax=Glossina austeni TaxID=7395 RepID=A0A1A9VW58_GLOAU